MSDKGKIILISDIWSEWETRINNVPQIYTFTVGDDEVFDEDFVKNIIECDYMSRSFRSPSLNAVTGIEKLWTVFRLKHDSEFATMYTATIAQYNPLNTYSETKLITPNITAATTNTYGRTSTNSGGVSTTYGRTETRQTNTYDGTLRDSEKVTNGGSDSNTNTLKNTLGGTDSSSTTTSGTSTETINGYKESPVVGLEKDISFKLRYNVADNFIKAFFAEYTFFDNDNSRGCNLWLLP